VKYFKWVIRRNHIKDCPMTIQYIGVAMKIWGKNIAALKGKTTQEQDEPGGQGLCEGSQGVIETPQRVISDN
jgi:hypothetical protein